MSGFKKFLIRGNLVDLAVAVVVGAAFNGLVNDFVKSFIGPLLALVGGKPDFTNLAVKINGTPFPYGVFLTSAISFLITAAIIYFLVVLPIAKLLERMARKEEATERECPQCLSEIPIKASRCRFCTSVLDDAAVPAV
ncbi:large conductance mechanosensitive channel protein MscL [Actinomadura barringtoniae]|uniref:Large conductance mechanosensitive channel protein MscL n=1 Tax=Actinomadura barringtoniae TaxID=1427535 RepID=A0A939PCK5_9ACTN|nr:large conductance mechanosensitive channel protein MscL [Actinomadura barringtoniae]MBO2447179.1 large conductance mechanosensitive channel protein MscL [Actinomadura barringtoniae]